MQQKKIALVWLCNVGRYVTKHYFRTLSIETLVVLLVLPPPHKFLHSPHCVGTENCTSRWPPIKVSFTQSSLEIDSEVEREGHTDSYIFSLWTCKWRNMHLLLQQACYVFCSSNNYSEKKFFVFCWLQVKDDVLEKLLPGPASSCSFQPYCTISLSQCRQVTPLRRQTVTMVSPSLLNLSMQDLFQESNWGNKEQKLL